LVENPAHTVTRRDSLKRKDDHRDDRQVQEQESRDHHRRDESRAAAVHRCPHLLPLRALVKHDREDQHEEHRNRDRARTGQSRLLKNSSHSTRPIISASGPPSSAGITNSPTAGMKTSMQPAMMPPW
jgi:hypothetical protein